MESELYSDRQTKTIWPTSRSAANGWIQNLNLAPLELHIIKILSPNGRGPHPDGILEAEWRGWTQQYAFHYQNRDTPYSIKAAIDRAQGYSSQIGFPPLIIVPYLSHEIILNLEKQQVSGLDRSGNGIILAPNFAFLRSGEKDRHPILQSKLNVYRGNSSLFSRCFLLRSEFSSLSELRQYALSRFVYDEKPHDTKNNTILTLSTASKVAQELEEDLIIKRDERKLLLMEPNRLMSNLLANYTSRAGTTLSGKTTLSAKEVWQRLEQARILSESANSILNYTATGLGSAARYRVLSGPDQLSLYVNDPASVADLIELRPTRIFPNVELTENQSDLIYFDTRRKDAEVWASPIQTWLELASGGPREREAAQILGNALKQGHGEAL